MSDRVKSQITSVVDFCSPICRYRTDFLIDWRAGGARYAYNRWKVKPRLLNLEMIPQLVQFVEEAELGDIRP